MKGTTSLFASLASIVILSTRLSGVVDGAASTRLCTGANRDCVEEFDMSCTEVIREYAFTGGCCSLADVTDGSGGNVGCELTVVGASADGEVTCTYDERECPTCCTVEGGGDAVTASCVAPSQVTIFSENTSECPASSYDPFPSTFPLVPFSVAVVGNEDDAALEENVRKALETYLDDKMGKDYPGVIIKLGKPDPFSRRHLQGADEEIAVLDFAGNAILSNDDRTIEDGIVAAQNIALEDLDSLKEHLSGIAEVAWVTSGAMAPVPDVATGVVDPNPDDMGTDIDDVDTPDIVADGGDDGVIEGPGGDAGGADGGAEPGDSTSPGDSDSDSSTAEGEDRPTTQSSGTENIGDSSGAFSPAIQYFLGMIGSLLIGMTATTAIGGF